MMMLSPLHRHSLTHLVPLILTPMSQLLTSIVIQVMKALTPSWVLQVHRSYPKVILLILFLSEHLKKDWNAPIYAFFQPIPSIDHDNGWHFHEFTCAAKSCKKKICCYLDKKDSNSTSNLRKHAKQCWGAETVAAADQTKNTTEAHASVTSLVMKNGSITAIFERVEKAKVTYLH